MTDVPSPPQYMRVNVLIATAILVVLACLFVVVQLLVKDEFAKGILTLVLGRFLGYVDNIYNFEFGTTRSSSKKDDTITALTTTAATVATTAQAVQVASDVVAATAAPASPTPALAPGPILAADVKVEAAGNVTVNEEKKP